MWSQRPRRRARRTASRRSSTRCWARQRSPRARARARRPRRGAAARLLSARAPRRTTKRRKAAPQLLILPPSPLIPQPIPRPARPRRPRRRWRARRRRRRPRRRSPRRTSTSASASRARGTTGASPRRTSPWPRAGSRPPSPPGRRRRRRRRARPRLRRPRPLRYHRRHHPRYLPPPATQACGTGNGTASLHRTSRSGIQRNRTVVSHPSTWIWNWNCGENATQYQTGSSDQHRPVNVNVGIRIASPGNDGPVTQTNIAVAIGIDVPHVPTPAAAPGGGVADAAPGAADSGPGVNLAAPEESAAPVSSVELVVAATPVLEDGVEPSRGTLDLLAGVPLQGFAAAGARSGSSPTTLGGAAGHGLVSLRPVSLRPWSLPGHRHGQYRVRRPWQGRREGGALASAGAPAGRYHTSIVGDERGACERRRLVERRPASRPRTSFPRRGARHGPASGARSRRDAVGTPQPRAGRPGLALLRRRPARGAPAPRNSITEGVPSE